MEEENKIIIKRDSDRLKARFFSTEVPRFTNLDKRYLGDFLTYLESMKYRTSYEDTYDTLGLTEVKFDFYYSGCCYVYLGGVQTSYLFENIDNGFGFEHFLKDLKLAIPNYEDYLQ